MHRVNQVLKQLGPVLDETSASQEEKSWAEPLQNDVKLLARVLLETMTSCSKEDAQVASKVAKIVEASQTYRYNPSDEAFQALSDCVTQLSDTEVLTAARAFHEFMSLSNLAESQHRLRRRRLVAQGKVKQLVVQQSVSDAFTRLLGLGFSPADIRAALVKQKVEFVLTAHPTQATRRTLLAKYAEIAKLLSVADRGDLTQQQRDRTVNELRREILTCWRTTTVQRIKPTPVGEAKNGLAVVEDILWEAVPRHLRTIDEDLKRIGCEPLPPDSSLVRLGSWMGGDRDGNPYVTSHVRLLSAIALAGCS